jgi:N-acetyl-1-D-myo-inositol-2-amino-2-deoxy-alpha-D-glucopyranoside deacetylase
LATLLALHAHPDDETLTMGGTLARYSAEGVRTVIVTCTSGDLGDVLAPGLSADGESVGTLRERELDAATRRLGVSRVVKLGYLDSGMAGWPENTRPGAFAAADLDEAVGRVVEVIREERPQVMVIYDASGGYGHPDHVRVHQVGVAAFQRCRSEDRPAKLYFVRFPRAWATEFRRALKQAGLPAPRGAPAGVDSDEVAEIGVPDQVITTEIDVAAYVQTKLAALVCHASQIPPEHFLRRMPADLAHRLWAHEYYSREVGPTSKQAGERETDLFSGLA